MTRTLKIRKVDFVTDKQTTLFCRYHKVADGYGLCHVVIILVEHLEGQLASVIRICTCRRYACHTFSLNGQTDFVFTRVVKRNGQYEVDCLVGRNFPTGIRIGEYHGYGLKNINRIVQENHGDFYTKKKDGVFTVQVRLNCEN